MKKEKFVSPDQVRGTAIGYIRTAVFDPTGENLKKQEEQINVYCLKKELALVAVFSDNGASGLNINRDGWNALKDYLNKNSGDVHALVVCDLQRISREYLSYEKELAALKNVHYVRLLVAQQHRPQHSLPAKLKKGRKIKH